MCMPSRPAHDIVGVAAGFVAWLVVIYFRGGFSREIEAFRAIDISFFPDVLQIIVFIGLAVMGSRLPDYVEPPVSSKHRGAFHNLLFFVLLTILFIYWVERYTSPLFDLALAFVFGYDSHLALDALA